jgi:carbon monoxide dehydrogenase subunit G
MNGNGNLTLDTNIEKVWEGLFNPSIIENCMMGCKKLTLIDHHKYLAELTIGVPPVSGKYEANIETEEIEKWKTYKLSIKAEGDAGSVSAVSLISLVPESPNSTTLSYNFEAEVGGKASRFGKPILKGVGKLMIQDFFKKFGKELKKVYSVK